MDPPAVRSQDQKADVEVYLRQQFKKIDFEKTGLVDRHYLWVVIKKLHFHLTDAQVKAVRAVMESSAGADATANAGAQMGRNKSEGAGEGAGASGLSDDVTWDEFARLPAALQSVYAAAAEGEEGGDNMPSEDDWVELPIKLKVRYKGSKRRPLHFNKRTGQAQWEKPETEGRDDSAPVVAEYLQALFERVDTDGRRRLTAEQLAEAVALLTAARGGEFRLAAEQARLVRLTLTADDSGCYTLAEFCEGIPQILADNLAEQLHNQPVAKPLSFDEERERYWCELPTQDMWKTYWYDKRSGKTQWKEPRSTDAGVEGEGGDGDAPPRLRAFFDAQREKFGEKVTDALQKRAFLAKMKGLKLGLSEGQAEMLFESLHPPTWTALLESIEGWLQDLYAQESEAFESDWCELPIEGLPSLQPKETTPTAFWYNKRTGRAAWEGPPTVGAYLRERVLAHKKTTTTKGAQAVMQIHPGDFADVLLDLDLELTSAETRRVETELKETNDGFVDFAACAADFGRWVSEEGQANLPSFEQDWCHLRFADISRSFWYNKRERVSRWKRPNGPDDPTPGVRQYLTRAFKSVDTHQTGTLSSAEFRACVLKTRLGLQRQQLEQLEDQLLQPIGVRWDVFVEHAEELLRQLMGEEPVSFAGDWCKIPHFGQVFWYNKRYAISQWDPPPNVETYLEYLMTQAVERADQSLDDPVTAIMLSQTLRNSALELSGHHIAALLDSLAGADGGVRAEDVIRRTPALLKEMIEATDLQSYLTAEFCKADPDGTGELPAEIFFKITQQSFQLTDEQVESLQSVVEIDEDNGSVNWHVFAPDGILLVVQACAFDGAFDADHAAAAWITMMINGRECWFNRGSGDAVWDKPLDVISWEALEEAKKQLPTFPEYLRDHFEHLDTTGLGKLKADTFWKAVRELMHLTDDQLTLLQKHQKGSGSGSYVLWQPFTTNAAEYLRRVYRMEEESESDWVALQSKYGVTFWFNKRLGRPQWEKPPIIAEKEAEMMHRAAPTLKEYLSGVLSPLDVQSRGLLPRDQMWQTVKQLPLYLSDSEIHAFQQSKDLDGSDRNKTYWLNKRTGQLQWQRPPNVEHYLSDQFVDFDVTGDGELTSALFMKMLKDLPLNITYKQMSFLRSKLADSRGKVSLQTFVQKSLAVLRQQMGNPDAVRGSDWCELSEDGRPYWFNKRNGQALWTKPRVLLDLEQEVPDIRDYLLRAFKAIDARAQGEIEYEDYYTLVESLGLGLRGDQIDLMLADMDIDRVETVARFVDAAKQKGSFLYMLKHVGGSDTWGPTEEWCALLHSTGREFWFNKKTFERRWDKPEIVTIAERELKRASAEPTPLCNKSDVFWSKVMALPLNLQRSVADLVRQYLPVDVDGRMDVSAFVSNAQTYLRIAYSDEDDSYRDWCALDHLGKQFWFNKRLGKSQWEAPPRLDDYLQGLFSTNEPSKAEAGEAPNDPGVDKPANLPAAVSFTVRALLQKLRGSRLDLSESQLQHLSAGFSGRRFWYNMRTGFAQWESPPDLFSHLAAVYGALDPGDLGELPPDKFFEITQQSFQLTDEQMNLLRPIIDYTSAGLVSLADFVNASGRLLRRVYAEEDGNESFESDWCDIQCAGSLPESMWLNKRTGEVMTEPPPTFEAALRSRFDAASADDTADDDASGTTLKPARFWDVLQRSLALSDLEVYRLREKNAALLKRGVPVAWADFVYGAAADLRAVMDGSALDLRADWCYLQDEESGQLFAYNKRTGRRRRDMPVPPLEGAVPDKLDCLVKSFRRAFPMDKPSRDALWRAVRSLPMNWTDEQFESLKRRVCEGRAGGAGRRQPSGWNDLVRSVLDATVELQQERPVAVSDWALLHLETTLTSLDLSANAIGPRGAESVADALCSNVVLTELDMSSNRIGHQGASAFARALCVNGTLRALNLWACGVRADGAEEVADALLHNGALRSLGLRENGIGISRSRVHSVGAEHQLAKLLAQNSCVTNLDLWGNSITDEGACLVFEQLAANRALVSLNMRFNGLGPASMQPMWRALRENQALRKLDLWGNCVGDEGARQLAGGLRENASLEVLSLRENGVGDDGAAHLAGAMRANESRLRVLNLRCNSVGKAGAEQLRAACAEGKRIERVDLRENPAESAGIGLLGKWEWEGGI
eukprot:g1176.t1